MTEPAASKPRVVAIRTDTIELAQLLKLAGMIDTGGAAKAVIQAGEVQLNGAPETQRGKKIRTGDLVTYNGETIHVKQDKR
ncbi:RNA-binding S4 domain-containing protein [Oleiharenicola lentus]|uniref:RNA-binding S4 domain-containing protein n=1 Tax=Oleiharenicola lentus TaxID=2508720 RepID=UPI003F66A4BE